LSAISVDLAHVLVGADRDEQHRDRASGSTFVTDGGLDASREIEADLIDLAADVLRGDVDVASRA
jgi:hypothetical protein